MKTLKSIYSHNEIISSTSTSGLKWLIRGFLPKGALAILAGDPKAGKTALATAIAYSVAAGDTFVGCQCEQANVLWISYEETSDERGYLMKNHPEAPVFTMFSPASIDSREGLQALEEVISECNIGLVVIDPLTAAVSVDSMWEGRQARQSLEGLLDLRQRLGVSFLVLHHTKKAGGRRGDSRRAADSNQIPACCSQMWVMEATKKSDGRAIELHGMGRGEHANKIWHILSQGVADFRLSRKPSESQKPATLAQRVIDFLASSNEPKTAKQIAESLGTGLTTVYNVLSRTLIPGGRVEESKEPGKITVYRAIPTESGNRLSLAA